MRIYDVAVFGSGGGALTLMDGFLYSASAVSLRVIITAIIE